MPKKKRALADDTAITQCIVNNVDDFSRRCAEVLKEAAGSADKVIGQKLERPPSTCVYFFTIPKVEAEIRQGDNRPVLALPWQNRWLYISINLQIVEKGSWRVDHVSVNLLQGESSDLAKESLLRAEWQIPEKPDGNGHAQPHWHVLRAAGIEESYLPNFEETVEAASASHFEEFLSGRAPEKKSHQGFAHFHYAMVTDWHVAPSRGPCHTLRDEAALIAWLGGCVRYICHQLDHVARKAGIRAAEAATV